MSEAVYYLWKQGKLIADPCMNDIYKSYSKEDLGNQLVILHKNPSKYQFSELVKDTGVPSYYWSAFSPIRHNLNPEFRMALTLLGVL